MKPTALLLALALPAVAGTVDERLPDRRYLEYAEGFRPFTREVRVVESSGRPAHSTAVVIGDRWALTAAHVVEDAGVASVGGNRVGIIWVHQDYVPGQLGCCDIAVLRCDEDFGLSYYPPLATGEEDVGDVVAIAGYGVTGRLSTGHDTLDGRLRAGTGRIKRIDGTILVSDARSNSPMPFCIGPGDSGGPWFFGAGRSARLAGISAFTMKDSDGSPLRSRAGEEQGSVRVSAFRAWVERVRSMVP